ncbi:MAG: hypothetical protein C4523_02105 [Myxococcales bacterium]|nr:MAG: hypothetical protein C4523_02105 [Myxococcales bacterium]
MKRSLTIDWDAVHNVFVFRSEERHAVLDLETGQVRYWCESDGDETESDDLDAEEVDAAPERYVPIDPPDSHEAFRWMERFADGMEDKQVQNALFRALDGRRPFRRFKDALADFPGRLEAWYAFEEECVYECMAEWAKSLPVKISDPPAWLVAKGQFL